VGLLLAAPDDVRTVGRDELVQHGGLIVGIGVDRRLSNTERSAVTLIHCARGGPPDMDAILQSHCQPVTSAVKPPACRCRSLKELGMHRIWNVPLVILIGLLGSGVSRAAQTPADNTKVNTRDRAKGAVTADQQKDNAADRDLTQKIRRALMQDKTLSSYAHNVKVITQGGQVTLKGPVRSDDEKQNVEAKATAVAGAGHVTNQMSVAPTKRTK
jgi:hypothetical protein